MSRPARLLAASFAVAAVMGAAGCGGGPASSHPSTQPTPSPTSPSASASTSGTATPTPSPTQTQSATPSGTPSPPSSPTVASCATSQLRASLGHADGAAGTIYYPLRLTNTGDAPCETGGYGGVSFVGSAGRQLGAPAQRDASQGDPRLLVLQPGGSVMARLGVAEAGNYDASACQPATARGLRVYPPNQTASLFVAHRFQACASPQVQLLTVEPYRPAA